MAKEAASVPSQAFAGWKSTAGGVMIREKAVTVFSKTYDGGVNAMSDISGSKLVVDRSMTLLSAVASIEEDALVATYHR